MPRNLFVAVGQDGLRIISADGLSWSDKQLGREGETYRSVAVGNGLIVATGSYGGDNIMAATADGKTWKTAKHDAKYSKYIRGLTYGNGTFMGLGGDPGSVGGSKPFVMLSKDGNTWEGPIEIAGKHILRRAVWGNDRYVAVGDRGRRAMSSDAREWKDMPEPKAIETLIDIAFGNGVFVGVGLHGLRSSTADGLIWTPAQRGEEGEHLNSVVYAKDRFVAIGAGATYVSGDGKKWDRTANALAPQVAACGSGTFVGAAWKGKLVVASDAITWKETTKVDRHIEAVGWGEVAT